MSEAVRDFLTRLGDYLAWMPDWLAGALILAFAALLAAAIHRTIIRLTRRVLRDRHPYVRSFLSTTTALTRLAVIVFALFVALPAAPFDAETEIVIAKVLLL